MSSSQDKPIELKNYLRGFWRRKGVILLCAVTTVCVAAIGLSMIPSEYESQVSLLIEDSQLLSRDLERLMGGIMEPAQGRGVEAARLAKLAGRIRSRPFLERVIRMLKMDEDPFIRTRAESEVERHPGVSVDEMAVRILVKNLQSRIRFGSVGSGIYKIIAADYSPENAQLLASWISEIFVDVSSQEVLERIRAAHEFGNEQMRIYEQHLSESEAELENYQQNAIGERLDQGIIRGDNYILAETLQREISEDITTARTRLNQYSRALSDFGNDSGRNELLQNREVRTLSDNLKAALTNDLKDRLSGQSGSRSNNAGSTYNGLRGELLPQVEVIAEDHYPRARIDEITAISRYIFSKIDLDVQTSADKMLSDEMDKFHNQAEATPGGEIQLTRLQKKVASDRELLQSFQAQLVASDVSQAVEITKLGLKIEVLDPAQLPLTASRPDRRKIIIASLLLGPLIGIGFAFLSETLDPVLRTLDDFKRIVPEPILGLTPLLAPITVKRSWFRRHWVAFTIVSILLITTSFFIVREKIVQDLIATGVPVQMVEPEGAPDETSR